MSRHKSGTRDSKDKILITIVEIRQRRDRRRQCCRNFLNRIEEKKARRHRIGDVDLVNVCWHSQRWEGEACFSGVHLCYTVRPCQRDIGIDRRPARDVMHDHSGTVRNTRSTGRHPMESRIIGMKERSDAHALIEKCHDPLSSLCTSRLIKSRSASLSRRIFRAVMTTVKPTFSRIPAVIMVSCEPVRYRRQNECQTSAVPTLPP
jgi:hypothetical protein